MSKPLLLGECPSSGHGPAIGGVLAVRLCEWAGINTGDDARAALAEQFNLRNLFNEPQPRWSTPLARRAWTEYLLTERNPREPLTVVTLGRRAQAAVGFKHRDYFEWGEAGLLRFVAIPHPSTLNRQYNEQGTRERAGVTLREAIEWSSR